MKYLVVVDVDVVVVLQKAVKENVSTLFLCLINTYVVVDVDVDVLFKTKKEYR